MTPIGMIATAIALAAGLIITNWDVVGPYFKKLWETIGPYFEAGWELLKKVFAVAAGDGRSITGDRLLSGFRICGTS